MSDDAREQEIQYMMAEVRVHCSIFFNTYFLIEYHTGESVFDSILYRVSDSASQCYAEEVGVGA
jgi:hypothetical protein